MEEWIRKIKSSIGKYRYVLLVLALGLALMCLPEGTGTREPEQAAEPLSVLSLTDQLEGILGQIQGVGKVSVLLTEAAGAETIYRIDQEQTQSDSSSTVREETVLVTGSDRGEAGLVLQTLPPKYQGAVVVCQGADQPAVVLSIVEAVSNTTGIPTNRITVLKMK